MVQGLAPGMANIQLMSPHHGSAPKFTPRDPGSGSGFLSPSAVRLRPAGGDDGGGVREGHARPRPRLPPAHHHPAPRQRLTPVPRRRAQAHLPAQISSLLVRLFSLVQDGVSAGGWDPAISGLLGWDVLPFERPPARGLPAGRALPRRPRPPHCPPARPHLRPARSSAHSAASP